MKRKKDELDLIRLAETHPRLKSVLPGELLDQIENGWVLWRGPANG